MTVKEELHRLVDTLGDEDACEALDYLQWLLAGREGLTDEEIARVHAGEAEIERGEYITLDDLQRQFRA
ncbi:MAG: hypothetical protein HY690_01525 [Chloroflexi bacterium]|nr:hypothetical protein [Chloroflexota bacterium]